MLSLVGSCWKNYPLSETDAFVCWAISMKRLKTEQFLFDFQDRTYFLFIILSSFFWELVSHSVYMCYKQVIRSFKLRSHASTNIRNSQDSRFFSNDDSRYVPEEYYLIRIQCRNRARKNSGNGKSQKKKSRNGL